MSADAFDEMDELLSANPGSKKTTEVTPISRDGVSSGGKSSRSDSPASDLIAEVGEWGSITTSQVWTGDEAQQKLVALYEAGYTLQSRTIIEPRQNGRFYHTKIFKDEIADHGEVIYDMEGFVRTFGTSRVPSVKPAHHLWPAIPNCFGNPLLSAETLR